jgi:pSer/pThr/pTyr-binding forkhead associated (FHA) protein
MAKLKIKDEHGKERLHELIDDITTIGRASANTIQITDEKGSRQHFRIEKQGSNFKVIDLGSTNGTKLNGVKISADIVLRAGDQLSIGKTTFTYEDEKPPAPKPSKPEDEAVVAGETVAMDAVSPAEVKVSENAESSEAPKFVLKMLEGKTPGKVYELGADALTIGRHNSNTIQIIDDAASNYHAEIGREPIGYVLTDLGSTNGTRVKLKNKADFEKVVKTPLSVGMQIRVGKTLLEFDNFGKPVEDEALFGTVQLDQEKLEQVLAPPRRSPAKRVVLAILLVCIAAAAATVYKIRTRKPVDLPPDPGPIQPVIAEASIPNGDFEAGADESGNPKNFTIIRVPSVKPPGVTAEAQYKAEKGHLGLMVTKSGARSPSTMTVVETAEPITLEAGKSYEFSGAMKNEGDGLFGLRVTWIQGERTLTESPVVLGNTQPWTEKKAVITPPAWAQKMKLGVFVQGTDGKACFDDLSLKPATAPAHINPISNGGVALSFDSARGLFNIASSDKNIADGGTIILLGANGDPWSDLSTAQTASASANGDKTLIGGKIYDFVLQDWRPYLLEAQAGTSGVDLTSSVEAADSTSRTALRFYITGEAAKGDIAVTSGAIDKVSKDEDKTVQNVREILFNSGKNPQLDVMFSDPSEVEFKRDGKRRRVTIYFQGKIGASFASESVGQKKAAEQVIKDLQQAIANKKWSDAEAKVKELNEKFADRIPEAKDEATLRSKQIDEAWRDATTVIRDKIKSEQLVTNHDTAAAAIQTIERYQAEWTKSSHEQDLKAFMDEAKGIEKAGMTQQLEPAAEKELGEIKNLAKVPALYSVAKAKLQNDFLNPEAVYSKTKCAEKAKDFLAQLEKDHEQQKTLDALSDRLINVVANPFIQAGKYQEAIQAVENDQQYQQNKDSLPEVTKQLTEWRGKLKK